MAIHNRTKMLNAVLGTTFPESQETVWLKLSFWEERADRFLRGLSGCQKARLTLVGALSVKNFTKRDGTAGLEINLAADCWDFKDVRPVSETKDPADVAESDDQVGPAEQTDSKTDERPATNAPKGAPEAECALTTAAAQPEQDNQSSTEHPIGETQKTTPKAKIDANDPPVDMGFVNIPDDGELPF